MERVAIASLVRDQAKWLHRFLHGVDHLDYSPLALSYAFLEGNSADNSLELLGEWLARQKKRGIPFQLRKIDMDRQLEAPARLAFLRNELLKLAGDADYVLMIDTDVMNIPTGLFKQLLSHRKDIIAPMVMIEDTDAFYDTLAFRMGGLRFSPNMRIWGTNPIPVDSVGTCYLMNKRVASEIRYGEGESEQVAFCNQAREKGFGVFLDPTLRVDHVNFTAYGLPWH